MTTVYHNLAESQELALFGCSDRNMEFTPAGSEMCNVPCPGSNFINSASLLVEGLGSLWLEVAPSLSYVPAGVYIHEILVHWLPGGEGGDCQQDSCDWHLRPYLE